MASAPVWLSKETKKIAMRAVEMSGCCTLVTGTLMLRVV
jgi:hypothetical protein